MQEFVKNEEKIIKFWRKNNIFEKSIKEREGAPSFIFYEGPPTANGKPGIHHVLGRIFKDIICRYKTMRGFKVIRKGGWDTHGLPVELEIEKILGFKSKKEIEKYGIAKFNQLCKKSVWKYKKEWEKLTERIAFWLDTKNPYITYTSDYIETLWWILKKIWQKGLLYQGYKVAHYCPRCGTTLSSHEVAQGYKLVKEPAIYLKFKIKNRLSVDGGQKNPKTNEYLLVWTTTPWTLPANVAVAVNPEFVYTKIKVEGEYLILAKERKGLLGTQGEVIEELKGEDLLSLEYEPLFPEKEKISSGKIYQVIGGDFVSLAEGTGLVHIAPAFGEEDMEAVKKQKSEFPVLFTVDDEGKMKTPGYKWDGLFVKSADPLIVDDLRGRGLLFKEELYEHDYPFCWRCHTPLIYYAKEAWFIKMTAVKEALIENNQKVNWIPPYQKDGRFGEWLKEVKDWNLSRERFWGTPLPVWCCQNKKCAEIKVIGSLGELEELSGKKVKNLHRPYIDKVTFKCQSCGKSMKRVPEVIDCWFDSGAMPFAQWHYPFDPDSISSQGSDNYGARNKELSIPLPKSFPADFICEGIDQTRGWFYTLLAISTLLDLGPSYQNVISHGIVLDTKGQKMSKSRGNVVNPSEVISRFGADCVRFYFYTINPVGEPKRFDLKDLENLSRRFFDTIWHSHLFFVTYTKKNFSPKKNFPPKNLLDQWIISRSQSLNKNINESLDKYFVVEAARLFDDFVVNDLSNWYIRRSRRKFQKPKDLKEKEEACQTLYQVLLSLIKILAPFTPFLSETIYQKSFRKFEKTESVHLCDYPATDEKSIDRSLLDQMAKAREISALVLAERAKAKIKVRQPLAKLKIKTLKINQELVELIKEEVNVREVIFDSQLQSEIELDTKITPELKEEGIAREIVRHLQEMRKKAGLRPQDKISISCEGDPYLNDILAKNKKFFFSETRAKDFSVSKTAKEDLLIEKEIEIEGNKLWLGIKKI